MGCSTFSLARTLLLLFYITVETSGHGYLFKPLARSSMWRAGYPTETNNNDNEQFCGGRTVMHDQNNGQCGVCGDRFDVKPRRYEPGGSDYVGIVVDRYAPGQKICITMQLTTNHQGPHEIRLCDNNDPKKLVTQECFDKHLLEVVNPVSPSTKYSFSLPLGLPAGEYSWQVKLPPGVTCTHCILQWWWRANTTWGICPDGSGMLGCGPQETFVNCADVAIQSIGGGRPPPPHKNPYQIYYKDYTKNGIGHPPEWKPLFLKAHVCEGTGTYESLPGINDWCVSNCLKYPPSCPADKCKCYENCRARPSFLKEGGTDGYCRQHCLVASAKCPKEKCECS